MATALKGEDSSVRTTAASSLSKMSEIKDPRADQFLVAALADKDSSVRWAAVLLWYQIKDPGDRAAEPLITARVEALVAARVEPRSQ
jgi:HEAT repeat protein